VGLGPEQKITRGNHEVTDDQIVAMTAAREWLIYAGATASCHVL
jgi:hypothetical protein